MKSQRVAPSNPGERSREPRGGGWREQLAVDPDTGAETFLLTFPPRTTSPHRGELEYHTCHEENVLLSGRVDFDGWYQWQALGYLMHPPYWWHPAGYTFPNGATILIRLDAPVDFTYRPIPADWDGREWIAPEAPHWCRNRAVTAAHLDPVPWEAVRDSAGQPLGLEAKHLWDDVEQGWVAWLLRAPASWQGSGQQYAGSDELYLLAGDLRVGDVRLVAGGYYFEPTVLRDDLASEEGAVAIRWTRGAPWRLPPIRIC